MGTWLVTGANRGIGLEFARQLTARGERVVGTARRPERADELRETGARVESLDVGNDASVAALAGSLAVRRGQVSTCHIRGQVSTCHFASRRWQAR